MDKIMQKQVFDFSALVDDLRPVRALTTKRGALIPAGITAAMITVIAFTFGIREDVLIGHPQEMFLIRAGLLLLLGVASAHAVITTASPSVGKYNNGWQIALAGALLFPLSALIVAVSGDIDPSVSIVKYGAQCLAMSTIGALATAVPMVIWLRRGAPTSPERAGWLTGLASGGLGAFAYNLHCPFNSVVYIGLWYGLAVGICAVAGRLIVPNLIRW
jgi:hypothetical protein